MPRRKPPPWGCICGAGAAPEDGEDGDGDGVTVLGGVEGRYGVDMLRDPLLPKERLPPTRANAPSDATTVTSRVTANTRYRFLIIDPPAIIEISALCAI
jgi:hypothetical protein